MATVYTVEIVSPWINFGEQELRAKIEHLLSKEGNQIRVKVKEKKL